MATSAADAEAAECGGRPAATGQRDGRDAAGQQHRAAHQREKAAAAAEQVLAHRVAIHQWDADRQGQQRQAAADQQPAEAPHGASPQPCVATQHRDRKERHAQAEQHRNVAQPLPGEAERVGRVSTGAALSADIAADLHVTHAEAEKSLGGMAVGARQAAPADGVHTVVERGQRHYQGVRIGGVGRPGAADQRPAGSIHQVRRAETALEWLAIGEPQLGGRAGEHLPGGRGAGDQLGMGRHHSRHRDEHRGGEEQRARRAPEVPHVGRRRPARASPSATSPTSRPAPPSTRPMIAVPAASAPAFASAATSPAAGS